MKKIIVILILGLVSKNIDAKPFFNSWTKIVLDKNLDDAWRLSFDYQEKRQNGWDDLNLFHYKKTHRFKFWAHYKYNNNLTLSFSPISYGWNYSTIKQAGDQNKIPSQEYRATISASWKQSISTRLQIDNKTNMEYRVYTTGQANGIRGITNVRLKYTFNDKWSAFVWEEPRLNIYGFGTKRIFSENRLGTKLQYKINRNFKLELGYVYSTSNPDSYDEIMGQHNMLLYGYWTL